MPMHKALYPRGDIDYTGQDQKEEEDTLALRIAKMHQYKDSKTTLKRAKKRLTLPASRTFGNMKTNRKTTKTKKQKLKEK